MTDFTISIDNQDWLDGIAWAREQHNIEADRIKGPAENYPSDFPRTETDEEYVQWVMDRASASYAQQKANQPPPPPPEPEIEDPPEP